MTPTQIWMVAKTLLTLLPTVIMAVREGKVRRVAQEEVLAVLLEVHAERVAAATKATKEEWDKSSWERLE